MVDQKQLHKLFQSENLSVLIKNARELISNPIILTDINYNVLEMSDEPEISDPKWLEIKSSKKLEDIKSISDVFRQSLKTSRPLLHRDINDTIDVMRMAVAHRDQLIGFLEIPCYNTIPDQEEQELIVFVADVVCLIMKRDLGYFYAPAGGKEFFIHDLIEGRIPDENICRSRCAALQWNASDHYRFLTIAKEADSPEKCYMSKGKMNEQKKKLEQLFPGITAFIYGFSLKAIVPVKEDTALDGRFFADFLDYLKANSLVAGISPSSDYLSKMGVLSHCSEKALYYGQLLMSDETLFFYDKYSIYHILESLDESIDPMLFCHSAVVKLANYDRNHNTELLDTLRTFLYSRMNVMDAATKLYIHRNTMNNRLQKIDDLIHIDLQDSESIFHLMLSFHILEYLATSKVLDYKNRILKNPQLKHQ